ncbi:hypothetical protein FOA52_010405 [Chlamydomonas sp. UWO 241]|nr:hypothetical protein FOA52_010405 [Chlamydomonas sp. UWO 241]
MPPLTLTRRELKVVRDLSEFSKPVKQKKALVTLSQLCIHDPDSRAYIAAAGAIAPLVQLLGAGSSADTQERAATALWHLAKEGNADIIAAAGAIPPLVQLLGHGTPADVQNQACALLATLA